MSLLSGIAFNPVHRNKGIDAILVEHFKNTPILVRVQKKNETLMEAVSYLLKAKKTKQSKRVVLIQTQDNDLFDDIIQHEGLIILQSPSLQIANWLKNDHTISSVRMVASSEAVCATLREVTFS